MRRGSRNAQDAVTAMTINPDAPNPGAPNPEASGRPGGEAEAGTMAHAVATIRPHFDAAAYARAYRDLNGSPDELLRHFCSQGWKEGRNPHDGFDTMSYLLAHRDVAAAGDNPFYHYVQFGRREDRTVATASWPADAAQRLLGWDPGDWVALLRPAVDGPFYAGKLDPSFDGSFDLAAHFAYRGWLEERDPNPGFDVRAALAARPELRQARLNPLVAQVIAQMAGLPPLHETSARGGGEAALRSTRFPHGALPGTAAGLAELRRSVAFQASSPPSHDDPVEATVAGQLDRGFYLGMHDDIRCAGIDPVRHYCDHGWVEGRDPAAWFDTRYYLAANRDVAEHGLNPFWHYLTYGRSEGRNPARPGGARRRTIEDAADPDTITDAYAKPEHTGRLTRVRLAALLRPAAEAAAGLVVSVGHDCYIQVTGGIQLFIADEQAKFARQNLAYLNVSPAAPLLRIADPGVAGLLLNLVLDGRLIGAASGSDLAAVLRRIPPRPDEQRLFIVHCLFGHGIADLVALHQASLAARAVFWVHDYSSVCVGYTLLRNDAAFCHAPPLGSMACRVCVHGNRRKTHAGQVRELFQAVPFHVAAPSDAALSLWLAHADLPHTTAQAHPHCTLEAEAGEAEQALAPARPAGAPVRVAFIGYPRPQKGWPLWRELISRTCHTGAYRFFHLGSAEAIRDLPGMQCHQVSTSPEQPDAMIQALAALEIDLVAALSPWPETFSYAAYEALAGGTDLVCLADSGNIAATVLRLGRGVVAADEAGLVDFFESLRAAEYVRLCREQGTRRSRLAYQGTTASLAFDGLDRATAAQSGTSSPRRTAGSRT